MSTTTKQLDRKLGLVSVFCISMGAMMGSGIFVLPGLAAGITGPKLYLAYLLAGLFAMPAVLSKAELATAMPVAGGTYVYVDRSLGPWMGTITGLGTWFSLSSKIAFALVGLGAYLRFFTDFSALQFSVIVLVCIVAINVLGVSKASGVQIAIVLFCIVCLLLMTAMGLDTVDPALFEPAFPEGAGGILSGAAFVFVSYAGVTKIASIAEEVSNPSRNIPLGMLGAQLTAMALYAGIAWLITGHTPYQNLATDITPITTTANAIFGPTGSLFFAVVAVIALVSMANAGVLATSRKPFAMSRDNILPSAVRSVSERFGTPWLAIVMTGALILCLLLFLPVVKLAKLASGFKIFIFALVNLTVIVLRESGATWYKPTFRSPFYPWLQVLGLLGGVWLLYSLGLVGVMGVASAIAIGSVWYTVYARKRVTRRSVLHHLWGERNVLKATEQLEVDDKVSDRVPTVIVPIFGVEPCAERLILLASSFVETGGGRRRNDQMEVLRLEEVPESMQLRSHIEADEVGNALYAATEATAAQLEADIIFHDVVTHNAKETLHRRAVHHDADWIVMEWPTRRQLHYLVRHPLAWWIDHPPCDLALFLDRGGPYDGNTRDDFKRILVLAEPGPYDSLLVHVADRLASSQDDATITLFMPVATEEDGDRIPQMEDYHEQLIGFSAMPCKSHIERGDDPLEIIARISRGYDLLIIGAPSEPSLRNLFFRTKEVRIGEVAHCSVLKVKAPIHQVHHRFGLRREGPEEQMILAPHIQHAMVLHRLRVEKKNELFTQVGQHVCTEGHSDTAEPVIQALLEREERQNTALRGGVAISAPTVEGLDFAQVMIVTLEQAIDYESSDRAKVDVVLLVLAPSSDRRAQLWLRERMARMAMRTSLLERIRDATDIEGIRNCVLEIAREEEI